ncbi:MAG: carboxypeptidase-like regulatory domain-containing protein, partial [Thermoanaerobaculia bacterium]|nr:carboxypeptidase-like regulatory domain-containing protein [Thermoanaerobaculia bacterium]
MRRGLYVLLLLVVAAGPAVWADAPETGTVSGTVTDPSGTGLPGVSVTISGARGEKFTQTDGEGQYRFVLLVPGDYTITAELEGVGRAENAVVVAAGKRASIDMTLALAEEETITVTSEAPMVDKFNVTAGTTISADVGKEMAP